MSIAGACLLFFFVFCSFIHSFTSSFTLLIAHLLLLLLLCSHLSSQCEVSHAYLFSLSAVYSERSETHTVPSLDVSYILRHLSFFFFCPILLNKCLHFVALTLMRTQMTNGSSVPLYILPVEFLLSVIVTDRDTAAAEHDPIDSIVMNSVLQCAGLRWKWMQTSMKKEREFGQCSVQLVAVVLCSAEQLRSHCPRLRHLPFHSLPLNSTSCLSSYCPSLVCSSFPATLLIPLQKGIIHKGSTYWRCWSELCLDSLCFPVSFAPLGCILWCVQFSLSFSLPYVADYTAYSKDWRLWEETRVATTWKEPPLLPNAGGVICWLIDAEKKSLILCRESVWNSTLCAFCLQVTFLE